MNHILVRLTDAAFDLKIKNVFKNKDIEWVLDRIKIYKNIYWFELT